MVQPSLPGTSAPGQQGPLLEDTQLPTRTAGPARRAQGVPARPSPPSSVSSGRWLDPGCPPWCLSGAAELCKWARLTRLQHGSWNTRLQTPPLSSAPRPAPSAGPPPDWSLELQEEWDWKPSRGGAEGQGLPERRGWGEIGKGAAPRALRTSDPQTRLTNLGLDPAYPDVTVSSVYQCPSGCPGRWRLVACQFFWGNALGPAGWGFELLTCSQLLKKERERNPGLSSSVQNKVLSCSDVNNFVYNWKDWWNLE